MDPHTKTVWPSRPYCFDVPYRYAPERGDIKFVFELSRLQYLQPMAAIAAIEDDGELADLVVEHIDSWIAANPTFRGVNWISGIELALRLVSLLIVTTLIGDRAFSTEFRQRLHLCLAAHGYWLARYPSRFSSANNHRIAEAGALYLLGRLVPTLRPADEWARHGKNVLEDELALQFHDDGVGAEQSPTYAAFSLEWCVLCATIGERLGDSWRNASWHRMAQAGAHLRALTDIAGNQPRIGDDDEGRVLCSLPGPEEHVNIILGYLAIACHRPNLARPMSNLTWARHCSAGRSHLNASPSNMPPSHRAVIRRCGNGAAVKRIYGSWIMAPLATWPLPRMVTPTPCRSGCISTAARSWSTAAPICIILAGAGGSTSARPSHTTLWP
jgi:hypothetical protein